MLLYVLCLPIIRMYRENKLCNIDHTNDLVRKEYKRYKKRKPPPDFSNVIDFNQPARFQDYIERVHLDLVDFNNEQFCSIGLRHPKEWNIYKLKTCPGFIVVTNPFVSYGAQSYWVKQALTNYTKGPYANNLDILMKLDKEKTMWQISQEYVFNVINFLTQNFSQISLFRLLVFCELIINTNSFS